ncbi:hypothetical protein GCM10007863_38080 [Dyella mobilis]|nr:hypothetical protein GCM10007863_38080 [Dyella mobilis]
MVGSANTDKYIHGLLLSADSSAKFYPDGFDFAGESSRASSFAEHLQRTTGDKTLVEDYSANQDGSLFLRIALHSRLTLGKVAEIKISSFGRLATLVDCLPHYEPKIVDALGQFEYRYIPFEKVDIPYDGEEPAFKGETWYCRYFSPWYISL